MNHLTMTINDEQIQVKEYQGTRVVTLADIDRVHKRPPGTARKRFNFHKDRFIKGVDYFVLNTDIAQKEFNTIAPNGLTVVTESGYLMLVKSFNDVLAWEVQRSLVSNYFRVKEQPQQLPTGENLLAMAVLEAQKLLEDKDQTIQHQEAQIKELAPKADYTDTILASKDLVNMTQIAKDYGMGAKTMNRLLKDLGIQTYNGNQWVLTYKYQNKGYAASATASYYHQDGSIGSRMHTKWTQKGRRFLYEVLRKRGILPIIEQAHLYKRAE